MKARNRQNEILYNYSAPYGANFMACSVVLEVFVVIVHDVFCAVPTFSVQDIGNSKSQFTLITRWRYASSGGHNKPMTTKASERVNVALR